MSYAARLAQSAVRDLELLAPSLQIDVAMHLSKLCESPAAFSRSTVSPPYPPDGMMSVFESQDGMDRHILTILFRFGQDEETLEVFAIGHVHFETRPERMGPPDPDNPFPPD